jgi:LuxR family maltose regulon positive regulatory protein
VASPEPGASIASAEPEVDIASAEPGVDTASGELALPATKLQAPQLRARIVARDRLVERLVSGARGKLTVVSAPAGWGKTTAVLEWRQRAGHGRPFAWVTLDTDDSDPARFWASVVYAIDRVLPGRVAAAARLVDARRTDIEHLVVPHLVNGLAESGEPLVLVLDDYQTVQSSEVSAQLDLLVEALPPGVNITIVSRARPDLDLARLRVQGELTELLTADLRFSTAEAAELLLDTLGLRLSADDVHALQKCTEGWAAALQLAALSLQVRQGQDAAAAIRDFSGHDQHLVDYLGAEVLDGLDDDVASFLVQTSILSRMTPSLCDAVTGRDDSAQMLRRVEGANLFVVRLDAGQQWFRYHRLFADVLRLRLAASPPGEVAELHRRAAAWYDDEGAATDAVRHALLAHDPAAAHAIVSKHWNSWYNLGRLRTVSDWLDALGDDRVRRDAWLSAARVLVWADEGRLDELDAWLDVDSERTVDSYPYAIMRALHRFKSGDLTRADEELRRAEALRTQTHPFWPTVELCVRGVTSYWTGDNATARSALASAMTLARSYGNVAGHTYALGYLAVIAVEDADVAVAERRLDQLRSQGSAQPDLDEHFVAALPHLAAGLLAQARGDPRGAAGPLERAVAVARRGAGRLERVATLAALGRCVDQLGDRQRSLALMTEATALLNSCPDPGRAAALVADQPGARRARPRTGGTTLTTREAAVLRLLPGGLSLREIADELFVSHNTIKTHSRTLYRKLSVTTREQAVRVAREQRLL